MAEGAQRQGEQAQPASKTVNVKMGMGNVTGPYAGMTARQIKSEVQKVKPAWEVDSTTKVFDGKTELTDDTVITAGKTIELVKRMGEKGAA